MNLYFQFLTQNQNVEALQMLQTIGLITDVQAFKGRAKLRAQASTSRCSFSGFDAFAAKMERKRFNRLEVLPEIRWLDIGAVRARVLVCRGDLTPSPTCALW